MRVRTQNILSRYPKTHAYLHYSQLDEKLDKQTGLKLFDSISRLSFIITVRIVFQIYRVYFRYNGKALIDEDLLRSVGVTDFSKYRCDPDHEPDRMMPKNFPSLMVEEEDEAVFPKL